MRKFYNFVKLSETDAELNIYGDIVNGEKWLYDLFDVQCTDSVEFKRELDALGGIRNLKVYVNSPGGDPFAAFTMYSHLKRHPAQVTVQIDGLAASAATIIVCAGDKVLMPAASMMLFHDVRVGMMGYFTADELRQLADGNDQIEKAIASAYATKSGLPEKQLQKLLDGENWRTAKECKELGFVDDILYEQKISVTNAAQFCIVNSLAVDMSRFKQNPFKPPDKPENPDQSSQTEALTEQRRRFFNIRKKINS
jgi:ATP-dependent protease ClpP protease subunit